jgi:predicted nucleic acid-binding protein
MNDKVFVDSNILIYAYDIDETRKHTIAANIVRELWDTEKGIISTQVLQEFYVTVTQKIPSPLSPTTARGIIRTYGVWHVEINDLETVLFASELQERYTISFWDGMIVAAAYRGGANTLLTEDLNHGQLIEGMEIRNPFIDDSV